MSATQPTFLIEGSCKPVLCALGYLPADEHEDRASSSGAQVMCQHALPQTAGHSLGEDTRGRKEDPHLGREEVVSPE